jgi:hypothetical protein
MTALAGVVFTTALTGMAIASPVLLAILCQASRPTSDLGRSRATRRSSPTDRRGRADRRFLLLRPNVP